MDPIKDYVRYAVRHVTGVDNDRYDRSTSERVFIIDINGDVFNVGRILRIGIPLRQPVHLIVSRDRGVGGARPLDRAVSRANPSASAITCPYFGNCPGVFVANATSVERKVLEASGCPMRADARPHC